MEFKLNSVVALSLAGKPQVVIVKALQCINVTKSFMSRTIARYRDTGGVARQGSGRRKWTCPKSASQWPKNGS